jgi:trigger factor
MKVTLDRQGKNVVKLDLELEPDQAIKAYEQACRQLSHKVNIPGFRRGKAPRSVLEKTFGVEYIKRETLERLVPELLSKAITSESLEVITEPEIDSCDFNLGEPLKLQAKFEVRPPVTLGAYKGVKVEVPEAVLPEDSVDKALEKLAESKSELKTIESRPVVMGDTVLLDFECFVDGKLIENGKTSGLVLEMKPGYFLEGFCEQLVGHAPGKAFDVEVKFPTQYRNKELAGKDAQFKVEIKELRERVQPPIDEALAKGFGQESLDELKKAIRARLAEEINQTNEARKQMLVVEAIVKNAAVDMPETMIEREQKLLIEQFKRRHEQNGQSFETFENSEEFAAFKEQKLEEAKKRVLTSLVLGAVVRAEELSISNEEVMPYIAEVIAHYNLPMEKAMRNEELKRQVMEEVLTGKVVEFLVSQADITLVPDTADEQEGEVDAGSSSAIAPKTTKPPAKKSQASESKTGSGKEPESKAKEKEK